MAGCLDIRRFSIVPGAFGQLVHFHLWRESATPELVSILSVLRLSHRTRIDHPAPPVRAVAVSDICLALSGRAWSPSLLRPPPKNGLDNDRANATGGSRLNDGIVRGKHGGKGEGGGERAAIVSRKARIATPRACLVPPQSAVQSRTLSGSARRLPGLFFCFVFPVSQPAAQPGAKPSHVLSSGLASSPRRPFTGRRPSGISFHLEHPAAG